MRVRSALLALDTAGCSDAERVGYWRAKLDALAAVDDVEDFMTERAAALGSGAEETPSGFDGGVDGVGPVPGDEPGDGGGGVMSSSSADLDLALAHGEALLDDVAVRHPGLGVCGDGQAQAESVGASDDAGAAADEDGWALARVFEVLLERAVEVERDLAEDGHRLGSGCRYDFMTVGDDDGHVRRRMSAVVDDADGGRIAFCLDSPGVLDVVRGGRQRPLGDRVRVAGYVVAILGDAVCLLGLGETLRRKVVGHLGVAVCLLRALVRQARQQQAADADARGDGVHDQGQRVHSDSSPVGGGGATGGDPAPSGNGAWEPTGEDPAPSGAAPEGVA